MNKSFKEIITTQLGVKWRILLLLLVLIILGEGYIIGLQNKHPVSVPFFFTFSDLENSEPERFPNLGLVSVSGSWISNVKLAGQLQTTKLDCYKHIGYCIEATAQVIMGNSLFSHLELHEITFWSMDEIRTKNTQFSCVEYTLKINRKGKTVTSERTTISPRPEGCEGFQEEPIFMHLGGGSEIKI